MLKGILLLLLTFVGVAAVFVGQADDSPGLGGIGLIVVASSLWVMARDRRRRTN